MRDTQGQGGGQHSGLGGPPPQNPPPPPSSANSDPTPPPSGPGSSLELGIPGLDGMLEGRGVHPHPGQTSSLQRSPRGSSRMPGAGPDCFGQWGSCAGGAWSPFLDSLCLSWRWLRGLLGPPCPCGRAGPSWVFGPHWRPDSPPGVYPELPSPTDGFLQGPHVLLHGCPGSPPRPLCCPPSPNHKVHNPFSLYLPSAPPGTDWAPSSRGLGLGCFSVQSPAQGPEQKDSVDSPVWPPLPPPTFPGPVDALESVNVCREAPCMGQAACAQVRLGCSGTPVP